jgi:hypothetical protein
LKAEFLVAEFPESPSVNHIRGQRPLRLNKAKMMLIASAVLWAFAVSGGLWIIWDYENSPGTNATPPARWPADSRIPRVSNGATLIMMAHPNCPCTRASVGELALLMARTQGRVTAFVLLLKPRGVPENWEKTDLWNSAASIPSVYVLSDEEGIEAERFHSKTSGQTLLYDADGRLLFSGGITAARGHSGDNAGRNAIVGLLMQSEAERPLPPTGQPTWGVTETSVFGCPLFDSNSECRTGNGGAPYATTDN